MSCNYKPHKRILNIHTYTHVTSTDSLVAEVDVNIVLDEDLIQFKGDSVVTIIPKRVVRKEKQNTYYCDDFTLHHLPYERMVYVVTNDTQDIYQY